MRNRAAGLVVALAALPALVASPARALTPEQIERASVSATSGLEPVIEKLASDDLDGRDNDTPASLRAQRYLIARLRKLGTGLGTGSGLGGAGGLGAGSGLGGSGLVTASTDDDAYRQPFVQSGKRGTNLLALIRGRELPDEFVVVGAHYDHLGETCDHSPGGRVCNGATDNAAGVAVVLAIGNALKNLPEAPRRSVVLALWDAEEDGLLGSFYYVGHPAVPLAHTTYVNFDIQGSDLLPSLSTTSFAVGPETGGAALVDPVRQAIAAEGLDTKLVSYVFGQLRSDYANFVGASVPTVFFSDSTGACYHTSGDDLWQVDEAKLRRQSRIGFRVVATLAETDAPPSFVPPNSALATYDDAVAIHDTVVKGRPDLALFSPADQKLITDVEARLAAIVGAGPEAFDAASVQATIDAALSTIDALTRLPCPGAPPPQRRVPLGRNG